MTRAFVPVLRVDSAFDLAADLLVWQDDWVNVDPAILILTADSPTRALRFFVAPGLRRAVVVRFFPTVAIRSSSFCEKNVRALPGLFFKECVSQQGRTAQEQQVAVVSSVTALCEIVCFVS